MGDWKTEIAQMLLGKQGLSNVNDPANRTTQAQKDAQAKQAQQDAQDAKDAADKAAAQKKVSDITFKKGGVVKHQRGDGIARKGKTKGRFV